MARFRRFGPLGGSLASCASLDNVRRRVGLAGIIGAAASLLALLASSAGCSCDVDCSGALAAITSDDVAVKAVEVCADGGCSTQPVAGTPTRSVVVGGGLGEGDLKYQSGSRDYTVRLYGADGGVVGENTVRTDLGRSGECSCGRSLQIDYQQGRLTVGRRG